MTRTKGANPPSMTQITKQWQLPPPEKAHTLPKGLSRPMIQVLLARGIDTAEKLRFFLEPPHRLPYDPLRLSGMDLALQRLYQAVARQEKVGVFGDFDVDGITGTAIVVEGLQALGVSVVPYLPHRVGEGHGLSGEAISHLAQNGVRLIVTVDCGVTSVAEVTQARRAGVDVIITDHHTPQSALPDAIAVINPKTPENQYPFLGLSGAGLAFKLMQGIHQYCGRPWDRSLLGLAALGTIADLVPLVDENRFLVRQGLVELAHPKQPGLQALYHRAGLSPESINTEAVSFQIAPRLNASGRMSHALDSLRLLTTSSEAEAETLAARLETFNQGRRDLTEQACAVACQLIQRQKIVPSILLIEDQCITPGVAGLVAGRLVELFHRPAVVMAAIDDEYLVASARSIPEFNIVEAFSACCDLFLRYGGHPQAAGFTISRRQLPLLTEKLTALAEGALAARELWPVLPIDAEVKLADLTGEMLHWLSTLEPFGPANPQPKFLTRKVHVMEARYMGQLGQHVKLRVRQGNQEWTALAFNQAARWANPISNVDLVYSVIFDHWRGAETTTLKVLDFRPAG
jgi:single-stranded-DNA-specific exonuclease